MTRVLVALVLVALLGCGKGSSSASVPREIPSPDTAAMAPAVAAAFDDARSAVEAARDSADAWGVYAEVNDAHEFYAEAATCYRAARELDPMSFRWAYGLAMMLEYIGAPDDEVAASFETAARLRADYAPVHFRHGDALMRQGRLDDAIAAFDRALEIDDMLAMAYRSRGQALILAERPEEAIEPLRRAQTAAPNDRPTLAALIRALTMAGARADAAMYTPLLEDAVATLALPDPVRSEVMTRGVSAEKARERVAAALAIDDVASALDALRLVADGDPTDARARLQIGSLQLRLLRHEDAIAAFRAALAIDASLDEAHVGVGTALMSLGDMIGAGRAFQEAIRIDADNGVAYGRLATVLAAGRRFDLATQAFEEAERLDGLDASAKRAWGLMHLEQNQTDAALTRLLAAVQDGPTDARNHTGLAQAYEQAGKRSEAIEHYRIAAEIDPNGPAATRLRELTD